MKIRRSKEDKLEIGMSSLIDCVFLLLIFFLVTTIAKKENRDIDIELPVSTSSLDVPPDNDTMVIGVNKEKMLFYNGRPVTISELHQILLELSEESSDRRIRVDCDKAVAFSRVVEILDLCSFRGLRNVAVRTYDEQYNTR
ncbi:MAG: biopolymer transporter ExbD [Lentisphaeria bacterium]|nr:biopolymer transporter ExbD [Lentisphaeria bacterium]MBR6240708.1 biopolymer transporter ExbD [Lentisphaeria bacterium]MDD6337829.1 biopolymer transporter ExbD [Lentisphaeria bacterium]